MARWAALEERSGIDVSFAGPQRPWQRPSNEAFNGLLRRWLRLERPVDPRPDDLDSISHQINTMRPFPPVGERLRLLPSECVALTA